MIRVGCGSLACSDAEAVMRAIRSDLSPVNASSRDLLSAAGGGVEARLESVGAIPVGGAVITPAGALPSAFIIHVAVMSDTDPQSPTTIDKALQNGLRRASDWELTSLAVPPLGMSAGLTEPEIAAKALVQTLFRHCEEGQPPLDLRIAASSPFEAELFEQIVANVTREHSG
jgi:O-acetyl-ADP-ribose deacetylase (regulator of RNase III)